MIDAFNKDEDIHTSTASRIFNVPHNEVSREQRSNAKTVNFGIIYGVSAFGLSQQTNLNRKESKILIDNYYENYPTLREYMSKQIDFARENGYVETILGRKRYLMDINSRNHFVRGGAERNAINAPIQGSASEIMRLAMIRLDKKFKSLKDNKSKILLQIHDELIFEVPTKEVKSMIKLIKDVMSSVTDSDLHSFSTPLTVDLNTGDNWGILH